MSSTFKTRSQGLGFFGAVGKWIKFTYLEKYIDQHRQCFFLLPKSIYDIPTIQWLISTVSYVQKTS